MFKHLMVPVDGSDLSLHAVKMAVGLARTCHARMHVLHVVPPFHTVSYLAEVLAATELTYTQESIGRAEGYLAQARDIAVAAGVPCEVGYVFDDRPYQAIAAAAAENQCDLIVMASHGWRGLNRLLLGSETHKVLLKSQLPVLVCH